MIGNKIGLGRKKTDEERRRISEAKTKYPKEDGKKYCPDCSTMKPVDCFHKMASHKDGIHVICKECSSKRQKAYYEKNKEVLKAKVRERNRLPHVISSKRNRNLQVNYGITDSEYQGLLKEQNGCCAICGISQSDLSYKLYVDHSHETGKVRGLLCKHCNTAIGLFKDKESIMQRAISYLRGK